DNLYRAVLQAEAAVHEYGGFILSSTLNGRCGQASLTVKVPTAEVGNVINALGALGFVAHPQITGEDLTRRYVAARRETGQKHERQERLETMVERMDEDEARVAAEQNLGRVETETAQLQDETWDIDARTTLATISATLREEEGPAEPVSVTGSFRDAARSLWGLLRSLGRVAAWLIVFLPIWGTVFALTWLGLRRLTRPEGQ
ncbi:MAG: DUF4349 domain-containing protein, partial [Armatimonadota bacterium]|nr:DUF4349 domain-containing protein [Armatimonadota bacterium]